MSAKNKIESGRIAKWKEAKEGREDGVSRMLGYGLGHFSGHCVIYVLILGCLRSFTRMRHEYHDIYYRLYSSLPPSCFVSVNRNASPNLESQAEDDEPRAASQDDLHNLRGRRAILITRHPIEQWLPITIIGTKNRTGHRRPLDWSFANIEDTGCSYKATSKSGRDGG